VALEKVPLGFLDHGRDLFSGQLFGLVSMGLIVPTA